MLMKKNALVATRIVNLTKKDLYLYDEFTGEIIHLPHQLLKELRSPKYDAERGPDVYYVVERDLLSTLRNQGRGLQDLAVVVNYSSGRNNVTISYLGSAENESERVYLDGRGMIFHK